MSMPVAQTADPFSVAASTAAADDLPWASELDAEGLRMLREALALPDDLSPEARLSVSPVGTWPIGLVAKPHALTCQPIPLLSHQHCRALLSHQRYRSHLKVATYTARSAADPRKPQRKAREPSA